MQSDLTVDQLTEAERAILTELVRFGHDGPSFAAGSLQAERPSYLTEVLETRLTAWEVDELCRFSRAAASRTIAMTVAHRPDLYDAEDFFAWCFEPEPENRRPGPRVSTSAADADHARQLYRSIERSGRLRELFQQWDAWRRG